MRPIIYTPSGRAGEYANKGQACNLYRTCPHGCRYCYNVGMHGRKAEDYFKPAEAVPDALKRLEKDCQKHYEEPIFLSFIGDPYPCEFRSPEDNITHRAIEIIKASGNHVRLLTKGHVFDSDLDLLGPGDEVGVTLTLWSPAIDLWEPNGFDSDRRLGNLHRARYVGIKTWASFEPVIDPEETLSLLRVAGPYLDLAKIGSSNHQRNWDWPSEEWRNRVESIDWRRFALDAIDLCERLGLKYYIKADLRAYLPEDVRRKLEVEP